MDHYIHGLFIIILASEGIIFVELRGKICRRTYGKAIADYHSVPDRFL